MRVKKGAEFHHPIRRDYQSFGSQKPPSLESDYIPFSFRQVPKRLAYLDFQKTRVDVVASYAWPINASRSPSGQGELFYFNGSVFNNDRLDLLKSEVVVYSILKPRAKTLTRVVEIASKDYDVGEELVRAAFLSLLSNGVAHFSDFGRNISVSQPTKGVNYIFSGDPKRREKANKALMRTSPKLKQ